jgi:IMP dehydrogenase
MLDYNDAYIVPQYSDVLSRSEVDTTSVLDHLHSSIPIRVPVISANMDTVTDGRMAAAMAEAGALGALHRFMSIEKNVEEYRKVHGLPMLVSVGVCDDAQGRIQALYDAGARHFIIDIAHGHHGLMKKMLTWIKETYSDVFVVAGNVATFEGTIDLITWGADAVKVGIGPGAACTTKNVTGVTVPQFTAVQNCVTAARSVNRPITVIADGGVREIGDIAKALGAGADFVMAGRLFAGCPEAPHPGVYRGMASLDAMRSVRVSDKLPTPEGKTMTVEQDMHIAEVIDLIEGGLRSAFSYSNALNLAEFQQKCKFGFRKSVPSGTIDTMSTTCDISIYGQK